MKKRLRTTLKENPDVKTIMRRARAMEKRLRKVQRHHITYEPEWIVPIFQGEHFIVTQLQRRVHVSRGFIVAAEYEIARLKKGIVYDLDMPLPKPRRKKRRYPYYGQKKRWRRYRVSN